MPGSPEHSINEFGRAKHGNDLLFGQSQGTHPINQNTLDGMLCFHFPKEGLDDDRCNVLWTCPQLGAKYTHRSVTLSALPAHHQASLAAGFRAIVPDSE